MSSMMFYGFAAWVGSITSPTKCNWWPDDPNNLAWDPTKQIVGTDLGLTLSKTTPPAAAQVDDGMTTLGPLWPQGTTIGALFLAKTYYDGLPVKPNRVPPKGGGHDYEYSSLVYYANENGNRRFNGLHARVNAVQGTTGVSQLQIWNPGTGNTSAPAAGSWWIDLKANSDAASSTIKATSVVGTTGSVYIDTGTLVTIAIQQPKIPPYKGTFRFPHPL